MTTQIPLKQTAIFFLYFSFASLFMSPKLQAQVAQVQKQSQIQGNRVPAGNKLSNSKLSYKIIDTVNKTASNDIYVNERKMIHQTSVPALSGNKDSTTKTATLKIADLTIRKLQRGERLQTNY